LIAGCFRFSDFIMGNTGACPGNRPIDLDADLEQNVDHAAVTKEGVLIADGADGAAEPSGAFEVEKAHSGNPGSAGAEGAKLEPVEPEGIELEELDVATTRRVNLTKNEFGFGLALDKSSKMNDGTEVLLIGEVKPGGAGAEFNKTDAPIFAGDRIVSVTPEGGEAVSGINEMHDAMGKCKTAEFELSRGDVPSYNQRAKRWTITITKGADESLGLNLEDLGKDANDYPMVFVYAIEKSGAVAKFNADSDHLRLMPGDRISYNTAGAGEKPTYGSTKDIGAAIHKKGSGEFELECERMPANEREKLKLEVGCKFGVTLERKAGESWGMKLSVGVADGDKAMLVISSAASKEDMNAAEVKNDEIDKMNRSYTTGAKWHTQERINHFPEGSPVNLHNQSNYIESVSEGDMILSVNGTRGDPKELMGMLGAEGNEVVLEIIHGNNVDRRDAIEELLKPVIENHIKIFKKPSKRTPSKGGKKPTHGGMMDLL